MKEPPSKRIDFVDLTKGVCIILVVMTHIGGAFELLDRGSMLSCFRMPLYFFISGVFFKPYGSLSGFILRKINKLIIPFLFFYLSAFLLKYIIWKIAPGVFHLPVSWKELLIVFHGHDLIKFNPPIWFLVALFNCNILFYLVHFLRNKYLPAMFALTLLIGCAGFYLGKAQITLPLYLDVAMTALPFYVAGFWIRRYNFFLFPNHRFDKLIPLFVLLALLVMHFTATTLGMRTNNYSGNIFQFQTHIAMTLSFPLVKIRIFSSHHQTNYFFFICFFCVQFSNFFSILQNYDLISKFKDLFQTMGYKNKGYALLFQFFYDCKKLTDFSLRQR